MNKNKLFGFTLIELMMVIAILGILAAFISGNFITSLKKGRDARRKADLEQIQKALEMYYEDKRTYPTFNIFATSGLKLCETDIKSDCGTEKIYMDKVPNDPINGRTYSYVQIAATGGYGLYSCLENDLQVLPYSTLNHNNITSATCKVKCFYSNGSSVANPCVWGISSSNESP